MTILETLKGISAYPIPLRTIQSVAQRRGVQLNSEASQETVKGTAFRLAKADLLIWLSDAPDVSQGGQSYSFTDEQRLQLRRQADVIYGMCEEGDSDLPKFGYKGSRL